MSIAQILAYLAPLAPLLEPEMLALEASGVAELNALVASVSSPDLKLLLGALVGAVDNVAKAELAKLA